MLDPIVAFLRRMLRAVGRALSLLVVWATWPFLAAHGWYRQRNWFIKLPLAAFVLLMGCLYVYFIWQTQAWTGFDPNYIDRYKLADRKPAGQELPPVDASQATAAKVCQPSALVDVTADLIDFNVNQNAWISSMLMFKLGFFGMDWDSTPFFDNKAAFQRGVNQAVRRTAVELVDSLGRVRGTSISKAPGAICSSTSPAGISVFGPSARRRRRRATIAPPSTAFESSILILASAVPPSTAAPTT
jgi:hypothetical protein